MQWAIQLLLWSALWEQNEISIVNVIWQDSTSSRGGLSYLPDAKNSAQQNAQHVLYGSATAFFLSDILLCLSPLLCIAGCGLFLHRQFLGYGRYATLPLEIILS